MPEEDIIRALDKMICDREEFLRYASNDDIREEADALRALRAEYCSVLDFESEYKLMQKKYKHLAAEMASLRCENDKLRAELEEAMNPKRYYEVLLSDGSASVRVENGALHYWTEQQLVIHNKRGKLVAAFNDEYVVGIIKRGEWEKDEDDESTRPAGA